MHNAAEAQDGPHERGKRMRGASWCGSQDAGGNTHDDGLPQLQPVPLECVGSVACWDAGSIPSAVAVVVGHSILHQRRMIPPHPESVSSWTSSSTMTWKDSRP